MTDKQSHYGNIFGCEVDKNKAEIQLIPVPWEVTTSYGDGASLGPQAIYDASPQIDLFDVELGNAYEVGYYMHPIDQELLSKNNDLKMKAKKIVNHWDEHGSLSAELIPLLKEVNQECENMVQDVYKQSLEILKQDKIPAVIGGDHSTPLGLIKALCEVHGSDIGILHIDAHADLRKSYQGFKYSHASIMYNVMNLENPPKSLTQVAIRDFCEEEWDRISENDDYIVTFFDRQLKSAIFDGVSWHELCEDIVNTLPDKVYVSFDIDGLSPEFCPGTGTPVPGGLSFDQAVHLLSVVGQSERKIIGFDLNEVSPVQGSQWDGNVGARLLFKLCGWTAVSNGFYLID